MPRFVVEVLRDGEPVGYLSPPEADLLLDDQGEMIIANRLGVIPDPGA